MLFGAAQTYPFINQTDVIGVILGTATEVTTGSMFLTLMIILIMIIAFALLFGIPLEFTAIFVLPFIITCMSIYKEFIATFIILIFYLTFLIVRRLPFR